MAVIVLLLSCGTLSAQSPDISFTVSMANPSSHTFHVEMKYRTNQTGPVTFKMPEWTPGYYQLLHFAENVQHFNARSANGKTLSVTHPKESIWQVSGDHSKTIILNYDVKTDREFVAEPYLDQEHGYIIPGALFFYPDGKINSPVQVTIHPYKTWSDIATGLSSMPGKSHTYRAENYDILYDSPFLIGNLEELPSFTVNGIPHYFIGYNMGDFDGQWLIDELKKIVETATGIIGDIPYDHYTFIGIGPGRGGIEHLNSTTVSFSGKSLESSQSRLGTLFFLAHEYFHHYNVKRIRPIELGPFDYQHANRTNLLWIAEGITVYYEYMTVKRAGLCSEQELLDAFHQNIVAYQRNPGRFFQTLEEASSKTWSVGPFGRTEGDINKAISYYTKGPLVALLLNFKIQHATQNQKSLDDVMRALYHTYYQQKGRGFTQAEFRKTAEKVADTDLDDIFDYVSTTKPLDYNRYLGYAGYKVDTTAQKVTGGWTGLKTKIKNDSVVVAHVTWKSPAWQAGIRPDNIILSVKDGLADKNELQPVLQDRQPGQRLELIVLQDNQKKRISFDLGTKTKRSFSITHVSDPSTEQLQIRKRWLQKEEESTTN